jgi:transcriptional regulator with XRE-family HTH domain
MSQRALGVALGLDEDVAAPRINRYEKAVHAPDTQTLLDLAAALDVPAGFLVTEDDALAEAILGFARLPKAKQKTILAAISDALGPKRAEEVRTRLASATGSVGQ